MPRQTQYNRQNRWHPPNLAYTGEAARLLGVAVRTVEQWRRRGIWKPHRKSGGGWAMYSAEQISKCYTVCLVAEEDVPPPTDPGPVRTIPVDDYLPFDFDRPPSGLLAPREAAAIVQVTMATLARWRQEKVFMPDIRLPTGQGRYWETRLRKYDRKMLLASTREVRRRQDGRGLMREGVGWWRTGR